MKILRNGQTPVLPLLWQTQQATPRASGGRRPLRRSLTFCFRADFLDTSSYDEDVRSASCVLLACLVLSACGGDDSSRAQEGDHCNYPKGEVAYSEESELGYTPESVLAPLLGDHTCVWTWNDVLQQETPPSAFSISPGEIASTLSFNLRQEPIVYSKDQRPGDGNGAFSGCADPALSVPVTLGLNTADGVVDHAFALDIGLYRDRAVEGESAIDASLLNGYSFSWDASWQDDGLWLSVRAESGKLSGQLFQRAEKPFSEGVVAATWAITASFTCD